MTKHSEHADVEITVMPKKSWNEMIAEIRQEGTRMAKELREQGHKFKVGILAPRKVQGGDSVPLSGVTFDLDWKLATRLEMIELSKDLISKSYFLGTLDQSLPTVLGSVIKGKGLYEHGIGEFFLLYGKFEQKYGLANGKVTRAKMEVLVNGDSRYLKPYKERGKVRLDPLPYAVRNILSHVGNNPNTLDQEGNDLKTSIELLKSWVTLKEK